MKSIRKLLTLILASLLLSSCVADEPSAKPAYRTVSMDEAMALMKSESGYIILDVRTPEEYAEGHIPGAINVPNERIGADPISELPDKGQLILVYCRSGRRSKEASDKLAKLGYTNVVEFGGIIDYTGKTERAQGRKQ